MGRALIFTDTFTAADGTNILGYNDWLGPNGSGFMKIYSNKAENVWGGTGNVYHSRLVTDSSDGAQVYADITRPTSGQLVTSNLGARVGGRCSSAAATGSRVLAGLAPIDASVARIHVQRRNASDVTQEFNSYDSVAWAAGDTVRLVLTFSGTLVIASVEPAGGGTTLGETQITVSDTYDGQDYIRLEYSPSAVGGTCNVKYDNFTVLGPSSYDVVADPGSFIVTGTNAAIAPLFSAGIMLIPATLRPSNDNNPVGGAILSDWRFCNTFGVIDSQLTIRSDPGDLRTLILVGMGTGGDLFLERIQLNGITPVVSEQKFHVLLEAFIDPT